MSSTADSSAAGTTSAAQPEPVPAWRPGTPADLVVGVGCCRGISADEVVAALDDALDAAGLAAAGVRALASIDARAGEPGLREAALRYGVSLVTHPAARLAAIARVYGLTDSGGTVTAAVGTPSVAEAAALAGAHPGPPDAPAARLVVGKRRGSRTTVAVARHPVPAAPGPAAACGPAGTAHAG